METNFKSLLLVICLFCFPLFVNAAESASTSNSFSLEEIETMARMGVKVAFSGEREPHSVTTDMTPEKLAQAEMLDLSNLSLHTLPAWLARFSKLRELNLAKNTLPLEELEEVQAMKVLEVLDLSSNPLFSRGHKPLTEFFSFLPNLRVLSLTRTLENDCQIWKEYWGYNYPEGDRKFHPFYNDFNQKYGDFKKLGVLEKLDVSHNCIGKIDLAAFSTTLQELDLSHNFLHNDTLKFTDMPSLQKLSLQGQRGSKLALSDEFSDAFVMQQLRALDVDDNVIVPEGLKRKLESWKTKKEK